jgi:hypothetical protein
MRSRLTAREMYSYFIDGRFLRFVACDAYAPHGADWEYFLSTPEGQRAVGRTEDSLRRSCRKAMMKGTR